MEIKTDFHGKIYFFYEKRVSFFSNNLFTEDGGWGTQHSDWPALFPGT